MRIISRRSDKHEVFSDVHFANVHHCAGGQEKSLKQVNCPIIKDNDKVGNLLSQEG